MMNRTRMTQIRRMITDINPYYELTAIPYYHLNAIILCISVSPHNPCYPCSIKYFQIKTNF
jgi:hypothetical protein